MAKHGGSLGTASGPIVTGPVLAGRECRAVGLGAGQDVMGVGCVAPAIDRHTLFGQRSLLGQIVTAMQLRNILGDDYTLRILPRPMPDAVARIYRGRTA